MNTALKKEIQKVLTSQNYIKNKYNKQTQKNSKPTNCRDVLKPFFQSYISKRFPALFYYNFFLFTTLTAKFHSHLARKSFP